MNQDSINIFRDPFIIITVSIILLLVSSYLIFKILLQRQSNKITEYAINVQTNINVEQNQELLNSVITECWEEFLTMNVSFERLDHIDENVEKDIVRKVSEIVLDRISPVIMMKLSLYYNIDRIPEIITSKIYILTTSFVVNFNMPSEELKKENIVLS